MAVRGTKIVISGDASQAIAALDRLGIRTEEVAKETESRMGGAAEKTGGLFGKLGNTLGNWGLPFSESLSKIGEHIGEAETKGKKFGATMQEVGKVALLAGAAGFGAVAAESVKLGVNYQQATAKIAASSGTSVAAAKAVGDEFLKTGFKSTFSAQEIATAYGGVAGQLKATEGHALSAGDAMTVMQSAMDLSEASGASLNDTAAALAGTMQAYGLKTKDAAKAGDQLYNISVLTNQPILGLAQVLDRLKGRLGALAPSLSDVGSLMAFPSVAAQGSRGAMVVNTALTTLLGGSKNVEKELKSLGVSIFNSSGKFIGMRGVIAQLAPKLSHLSDQQKMLAEKTLFGSSAAQLMGTIIKGGVAGYDKAAAAVNKTGTAQSAAEKQANTLKGQTEKLKSGLEDLGVKLGEWLIPKLEKLGEIVGKVVGWFGKHTTAAKAVAAVVGGVLAATIGSFVAVQMGEFIQSLVRGFASIGTFIAGLFGMQTAEEESAAVAEATGGGFGPIGAAIGLLVIGLYELVTHWKSVWGALKSAAEAVWNDGIKPVFDAIKKIVGDVVGWIESHWKILAGVLAVILGPIGLIGGAIYELATHWQTVWGWIKTVLSDAWGFIKEVFGWIETIAIAPIQLAIQGFETVWGKVWNAIQTAVEAVWKVISGIFNQIEGAITTITGGIKTVTDALGITGGGTIKAGFTFGTPVTGNRSSNALEGAAPHFIKRLLGGWIPGAPGQPVPMLGHGSEYVLSTAMLSGAQPIDPAVMNAVLKSMTNGTATPAGAMTSTATGAPTTTGSGNVGPFYIEMNGMDSNPNELAAELDWRLRQYLKH